MTRIHESELRAVVGGEKFLGSYGEAILASFGGITEWWRPTKGSCYYVFNDSTGKYEIDGCVV